jgi:cytochrome c peroxidase
LCHNFLVFLGDSAAITFKKQVVMTQNPSQYKCRLFKSSYLYMLILLSVAACRSERTDQLDSILSIPKGFPSPEFPIDNAFTTERFELGKRLFYDPILSADSSISCASCHSPHFAFSDTVALSLGVAGRFGNRNAPTLANVAYHPHYTREGGIPTLEMQIQVPIQEHNEFDFNIILIAERLNANASYVAMSQSAYGREPDAFVITRSLACFERALISGNSAYDKYQNGDNYALNEAQLRGKALFFSDKTNCSACHGGFNFTDYAFENNGLYENYADPGRFRLTNIEGDRALFKVPSLRNIAVTAPYMHDGSLATLDDVLTHYNNGGAGHVNESDLVRPLGLSNAEISELKAFLITLTDIYFIDNEHFR